MFFLIILWIILGYLIGSIPWALVIGKLFFKKDIRNYGSGNLGGSNAGRVLGGPIGVIVIVLDALKAFLVMTLCNYLTPEAVLYSGLAAVIGHCYPIFANYRGGKGVACAYGYLLAVGLYVTHDIIFAFIYPVLFFFLILGITKYVSLGSMCGLLFETLIGFLTYQNNTAAILVLLLTLFVIFRHYPNIKRLLAKKETKVKFLS